MAIMNLQLLQENYDVPSELAYYATIMSYVILQNYSISGLSFYNYNGHLIMLIAFFLAQRIWFVLWRIAQFTDTHGLRFAVYIMLFFVCLDSLYCGVRLHLRESFTGSLYLTIPLVGTLLFYLLYLPKHVEKNVFTAELFSMLSRCVYHSLETWYCIGFLPLMFLPYEDLYVDTSRCVLLTGFIALHSFLMLVCLELHCLGPEVLQQTRMLGGWKRHQEVPDALEWTYHNCPYPEGAVVQWKGRYYEAIAMLNTIEPSCSSFYVSLLSAAFADSERTKALLLAAISLLSIALLPFIFWSNQWSTYSAMLVLTTAHFCYLKSPRYHAFFNPAPLNLAQLQLDLHAELSHKENGVIGHLNGHAAFPKRSLRNHLEQNGHKDGDGADASDSKNLFLETLSDCASSNSLECPLFMSAVSASTMFFFGPSCQGAPTHDTIREEDD